MISAKSLLAFLCATAIATAPVVAQDASDNLTATHEEDGKWLTADDVPRL